MDSKQEIPEDLRGVYEVLENGGSFNDGRRFAMQLIERIASLEAALKKKEKQEESARFFQRQVFDALGSSVGAPPWEKIAALRSQLTSAREQIEALTEMGTTMSAQIGRYQVQIAALEAQLAAVTGKVTDPGDGPYDHEIMPDERNY